MRLPPTEIEALKRDLERDPTPLEERLIRKYVHLEWCLKKAQKQYDRQEPILRTIGSNKQEKIMINPLAEHIPKLIERQARILNYLKHHDPKEPEDNEMINDMLNL